MSIKQIGRRTKKGVKYVYHRTWTKAHLDWFQDPLKKYVLSIRKGLTEAGRTPLLFWIKPDPKEDLNNEWFGFDFESTVDENGNVNIKGYNELYEPELNECPITEEGWNLLSDYIKSLVKTMGSELKTPLKFSVDLKMLQREKNLNILHEE